MNWKEKLDGLNKIRMRHASYIYLACLVLDMEPTDIVEIGVYKGHNAIRLREYFPRATLWLIDPWTHAYTQNGQQYEQRRRRWDTMAEAVQEMFSGDEKTMIIRKPSGEAIADVPDNLDLVFVDGHHSYDGVTSDIEEYLPKLRHGGLMIGHDYHDGKSVAEAVIDYFGDGNFVLGPDHTWAVMSEG